MQKLPDCLRTARPHAEAARLPADRTPARGPHACTRTARLHADCTRTARLHADRTLARRTANRVCEVREEKGETGEN